MDTDGLILAIFIMVLGIIIFTIIAAMIRFFRADGSIASKLSRMFAGASVPPYTDADKAIVEEVAKMDPVVLIKRIFIGDGTLNEDLYRRYIKNTYARRKIAERLYSMRNADGKPLISRDYEPAEGYIAHAISSALGNIGEAMVDSDVEITKESKNAVQEYIAVVVPEMKAVIV